jgi:hypothetical protein
LSHLPEQRNCVATFHIASLFGGKGYSHSRYNSCHFSLTVLSVCSDGLNTIIKFLIFDLSADRRQAQTVLSNCSNCLNHIFNAFMLFAVRASLIGPVGPVRRLRCSSTVIPAVGFVARGPLTGTPAAGRGTTHEFQVTVRPLTRDPRTAQKQASFMFIWQNQIKQKIRGKFSNINDHIKLFL